MKRQQIRFLLLGVFLLVPVVVLKQLAAQHGARASGLVFAREAMAAPSVGNSQVSTPGGVTLAAITVDYPAQGSIFPPEITPPTFLWRDASSSVLAWLIDVAFTDGSAGIQMKSAGERLRIGEIDPRCVSSTNQLPKLTPEQAAARSWVPDSETWEAIKKHSTEHQVKITITGFQDEQLVHPVSSGAVVIQTSRDPVGAPIFYRDVPLMPSELQKGVIKPLADNALPLIAWRLRDIAEPRSRLVLDGLHTCANCHSFSRDGKTLGMDLDGPRNDKGLYAIASVRPQMSIRNEDVISWSALRDETVAKARIGFMSQVSPDGKYVLTMIRGLEKEIPNSYYVVNFKDYRFLQVFYPTRGILAWYNRATGRRQALPGADDQRFVQTDPVWSPDGKYVVFARAEARDPYPEGLKLAEHSNDPEETQIRYDLCRIPFDEGKGGRPEMIAGASRNGMSNTFPKVSPDGRWIVFVKCRNGQLMRPDSQLYIVPAEGGQARRMRCNTPLMNSWHSFSPNGRWLVFSSKSRSPYTQMFLTHLDEEGNDSPAILVENATAANRAVNIPEFVNIPRDGLLKIDVPAAEFYRLFDQAFALVQKGDLDAGIATWKNALKLDPRDAKANSNLGEALWRKGSRDEGMEHFRKALDANPDFAEAHNNLGVALLQQGRFDEAITHFRKALEVNPEYAKAHGNLGAALTRQGKLDEGIVHFQRVVDIEPGDGDARSNLGTVLLLSGRFDEALPQLQKALEVNSEYAKIFESLVTALKGPAGTSRGASKSRKTQSSMSPVEALNDSGESKQESEKLDAIIRYIQSSGKPHRRTSGGVESDALKTPDLSVESDPSGNEAPEMEKLIASLEIPRLRKLAEQKDTDEGVAARRQIVRIFLHSFEAGSQLLDQKRNAQALACFDIAARAAPNSPYILYDLARTLAFNNQKVKALQTLEKAAEKGFNNSDQLEGDQAFEGLRNDSGYRKTIAKMRAAPGYKRQPMGQYPIVGRLKVVLD